MFKEKDVTEISKDVYQTDSEIEFSSRYGYESELQEMLEFCRLITKAELESYITKVFYDSKASLCFIETTLDHDGEAMDHLPDIIQIKEVIRCAALLSITQFQLFNEPVGHQNFILKELFNI